MTLRLISNNPAPKTELTSAEQRLERKRARRRGLLFGEWVDRTLREADEGSPYTGGERQ